MCAMNEGWFSRPTRKGASSKSSRRSVSRAVSSSGRIAKTGTLECRQAITEFHPADIVAEPGVMRGRESPGSIEAAGGDIHEVRRIEVLVCQWRSAGPTEAPLHFG